MRGGWRATAWVLTVTAALAGSSMPASPTTEAEAPSGKVPAAPNRSRENLIRYAEGLLDPRRAHTSRSEQVVVTSDSPYGRADVAMARNFEAVYQVLITVLHVPPQTEEGGGDDDRVHAYLFQNKKQYEAFAKYADPRAVGRSDGMYFPGFGILAFPLESYTQPHIRHVMLHECTHAFLDQRIRLTPNRIPTWLQEGLADYIGLSVVDEGEVHIGVFTSKTKYDSFEGMLILKSEASEQLARARRAVRHKLTL